MALSSGKGRSALRARESPSLLTAPGLLQPVAAPSRHTGLMRGVLTIPAQVRTEADKVKLAVAWGEQLLLQQHLQQQVQHNHVDLGHALETALLRRAALSVRSNGAHGRHLPWAAD